EGSITIAGAHIQAVEPASRHVPDVDLGDVAVLPGLVNAHTHLDLSGLRGRVPPSDDFTAWLRAVIRHRRGLSAAQVVADVQTGLAESLACGTTLLGDISSQGLSGPMLAAAPLWSVVFYELLGLPRSRARQAWQDARSWWLTHPATENCRPGFSPHAPSSVRAALFRTVAAFARRHSLPVAVHLAETRAERQLLEHRRGPFVDLLTELGVWDPDGLVPSPEEVLRLYAGQTDILFVHGNDLAPSAAIPPGGTVIYCPR